jgi:hypothetical protein
MKMLVMVLTDLAASCKKLDETSELPEELPVQVCEFVAKFNSLLSTGGEVLSLNMFKAGNRIARFLPRVFEVEAPPRRQVTEDWQFLESNTRPIVPYDVRQ